MFVAKCGGAGQEHGPFWNDEMTEWWHDGFFTPDLKVRKVGELESVPIYLRGFCEFTRRAEPAVPMPPLPSPSPSPSVSVPSATEPQLPSDAASEAADDTATATPSASASATTTLTENASAPTANVAAAAPMAPPQGFYPPPPQFAAGTVELKISVLDAFFLFGYLSLCVFFLFV